MKLILAVSLLGVLISAPAYAQFSGEFGDRRLVMIEDPLQITFTGDPARLTKQHMQQAIEIAALVREWRILNNSDAGFELSTTKNGRHVLHVMVTYAAAGCQIRYLDSVDMMYKEIRQPGRSVRVIHRNYNVWIRQLADAISNRIGLPAQVSAPAAVVAQPAPEGPRPAFSTRFNGDNQSDAGERRSGAHRETRDMQ
jgi:hypothetical protein